MTTHKEALEAAYLAGFNASGEGYNGEYPFGDKMQDPAENRVWKKDRDNYIKEALMSQSDGAQPAVPQGHEQEPVAWMNAKRDMTYIHGPYKKDDIPLYTTPPQRKPLTDEQIEACLHHVDQDGIGLFDFARAIEAAHGIKE